MTIVESFGRLHGTIVSARGERELGNVKFEGDTLKFDTHINHAGQKIPISFSGSNGFFTNATASLIA